MKVRAAIILVLMVFMSASLVDTTYAAPKENWRSKKCAEGASKYVYKYIPKHHVRHKSGSKTRSWKQLKKKKTVSCSIAASICLQHAGCLPKGRNIKHTKSIGDAKAERYKNHPDKAYTGAQYLRNCEEYGPFNCSYSRLPDWAKKKGNVYVYDSTMAVSGGNGVIWTASGATQLKGGRYAYLKNGKNPCRKTRASNKKKNAWVFKYNVLFVIHPIS